MAIIDSREKIENAKQTLRWWLFDKQGIMRRKNQTKDGDNRMDCSYHPEGPEEGICYTFEYGMGDDYCEVQSFIRNWKLSNQTYRFVIDGQYYDVDVEQSPDGKGTIYCVSHEVANKNIFSKNEKVEPVIGTEYDKLDRTVARTIAKKDENGNISVEQCLTALDTINANKAKLSPEVIAKIDRYFTELDLIKTAKSVGVGKKSGASSESSSAPQEMQ